VQVGHVKLVRRLLLGLIAVVLVAVGFNYVQTFRSRAKLVKQTARILSTEMLRSADSIEYTENEDGVTRFRLKAQRLLETRQGKSLLEGIEASDKNPDGTTRNHIRSRRAEYDREGKRAFFYDDVHIELSQGAEIRTNSLLYDLQANIGESEDKLELTSRQVHGWARGFHYDHDHKQLNLKADIDLTFERTVRTRDGSVHTENLRARSQRGYYSDDGRVIRWEGGAQLDSETAVLSGEEIEATFTEDKKRLQSLFCRGNSVYRSKGLSDSRTLRGDRMDFGISKESGNLEQIDVNGHASFVTSSLDAAQSASSSGSNGSLAPGGSAASRPPTDSFAGSVAVAPGPPGSSSEQVLGGSSIHVDLDPVENLPTFIRAQGSVEFRNRRDADDTTIRGQQLEASFLARSSLLERMRVWGGAHMTSRSSRDLSTDDLQAEEIRISFKDLAGRNALQQLDAERSVKWISRTGAKEGGKTPEDVRSLTATTLQMTYAAGGDSLEGGRAAGDVLLTGIPASGVGQMELRRMKADEVRFRFFPRQNKVKTIDGDGHVDVLYSRPPAGGQDGAMEESRTSSSKLQATFREADGTAEKISQWGNFVFQDGTRTATSGRSDYSAENDLMILHESPRITDPNGTTTGEVISYDRKQKVLIAHAHVRSVLSTKENGEGTPFSSSSGSSSPSVVTADEMRYQTEASHVRYSGNVQMLSESSQLQATILDIFDSGDRVEAQGDIRHLLPRSVMGPDSKTSDRRRSPKKGPSTPAGGPSGSPVTIQSVGLRYLKTENSIHYTENVVMESDDLWMSSDSMDAVFEPGGRRIERAAARGKVHIRQGAREVKGAMGDYYLVPGKFVVLGDMAEISDPEKGKSSARRLTFFTTDDRILLENR
jgi:LPS export ABC transporter protein LptC